MLKWVCRIALLALVSPPAFAWEGNLRSYTEYFPYDYGPPTTTLVPRLGIELGDVEKFSRTYRFSFKGNFQTNLETKYAPENYFGDISEAYLEMKKSAFKLRLGYNTFNWGVLDVFSPMDVVNQRVFFDPMNTTKRGSPMVDLEWSPTGWAFSAVYIPWQTKAAVPSNDSRWYPRSTIQNYQTPAGTALLPDQVKYNIEPYIDVDHALYDNYGMNIVKRWASLDLHLMYFEGAAPTPSFNLDLPNMAFTVVNLDPANPVIQVDGPVSLNPIFYRLRTTGFGFSSTLGGVIVRGETVYQSAVTDPGAMDYSAWAWQSGLGVEKNWEIGSYTVTQIIQYYHGQLPHSSDNLPTSGFRLFDDAALMGVRWGISDESFIYASALYNFPQEGLFWMLGYQAKLTDSLQWDISWRDISAVNQGLLKTYDNNDHAALELVYFF